MWLAPHATFASRRGSATIRLAHCSKRRAVSFSCLFVFFAAIYSAGSVCSSELMTMSQPSTYLFCGGGSGGHLFPGVAVAEELRRREPDGRIVFVGSTREIERNVLAAATNGWPGLERRTSETPGLSAQTEPNVQVPFQHIALDVLPVSTLFRSPFRFLKTHRAAVRKAGELLNELKPAAVIGLGGFASVPVVTAAHRKCPIVLLEQNRVPGRATSWLSRKADVVCLSFPETVVRCRRVELTGNPVRESIVAVRESSPGQTLLVLGGSQGAVGLNTLVMSLLDGPSGLPEGWRVVHQTGTADESRVRSHYESAGINAEVHAFISDMPQAYADSGLVISRAGGTTLAELTCVGRGAILVPIPRSVRDHQNANAACFEEAKGARIIQQQEPESADRLLAELLSSSDQREAMSRVMKVLGYPAAAAAVADVVASVR